MVANLPHFLVNVGDFVCVDGHEFVMKISQIGLLLWQRVRESNPCTGLERAVS
jgi:hypothetical protein